MDPVRYLYEVRPQKPVRIPGKRSIMRRQSILLTRDEVKEYMKSGAVYRKYTNGKLIRVTGATLDELHRPLDKEEQAKESPAPIRETVIPAKVDLPTSQHKKAPYIQESKSNTNGQENRRDKRKHGNVGNYRGEERGKSVVNNSSPQPQFNNESQSEDTESSVSED